MKGAANDTSNRVPGTQRKRRRENGREGARSPCIVLDAQEEREGGPGQGGAAGAVAPRGWRAGCTGHVGRAVVRDKPVTQERSGIELSDRAGVGLGAPGRLSNESVFRARPFSRHCNQVPGNQE